MAGRPLKYNNVEELETDINDYFEYCDLKELPYTIAGLASSLRGMCTETLRLYGEKEEYFATIKRAKLKCERSLVEQSLSGKVDRTMGIFLLKCNFGYNDNAGAKAEDKEIKITIERRD